MTTSSGSPGTVPPGWYTDPSAPPGQPGQRWWDGRQWTEHVVPLAAAPPGRPGAPATTPDGVPVATIGRRIGAYVIDYITVFVVTSIVASPFWLAVARSYGDYFDRVLDASRAGAAPPSSVSIYTDNIGSFAGIYAVLLVVTLAYHAPFLRWRAATPGKLALGLRVRAVDAPGSLSWRTVGRRLLAEFWYVVALLIPLVGAVTGLWVWADNLSAIGNPRRQALHDRFADTVVVDVRSTR